MLHLLILNGSQFSRPKHLDKYTVAKLLTGFASKSTQQVLLIVVIIVKTLRVLRNGLLRAPTQFALAHDALAYGAQALFRARDEIIHITISDVCPGFIPSKSKCFAKQSAINGAISEMEQ